MAIRVGPRLTLAENVWEWTSTTWGDIDLAVVLGSAIVQITCRLHTGASIFPRVRTSASASVSSRTYKLNLVPAGRL